jgi:8-oxo-dGTP diphosphatase
MIDCTFENGNKAGLRHVVVDVLVIKNAKILLVKRVKKLLEGGKWGLIGGFMERNETLHETIAREIFEETGYKIKDPTLLTIRDNPDRPNENRQNISFVFFCTALEKEGKPDWESTEIKWFSFDELPKKEELAFDHHENIKLYLKYKKENIKIPLIPF